MKAEHQKPQSTRKEQDWLSGQKYSENICKEGGNKEYNNGKVIQDWKTKKWEKYKKDGQD